MAFAKRSRISSSFSRNRCSRVWRHRLASTLSPRTVTVHSPPGDNLWLHRGIYAAPRGAVLVHECGADAEAGRAGRDGLPAECALVRSALPEVATVELGDDPAGFVDPRFGEYLANSLGVAAIAQLDAARLLASPIMVGPPWLARSSAVITSTGGPERIRSSTCVTRCSACGEKKFPSSRSAPPRACRRTAGGSTSSAASHRPSCF